MTLTFKSFYTVCPIELKFGTNKAAWIVEFSILFKFLTKQLTYLIRLFFINERTKIYNTILNLLSFHA